ncbi:hypothetical protein N0B44_15550 [Roseibacterium beibuensis]|uniref:Uncharacterized protein n=1 Tax=[Roseibacterium] beibuensis TaxID=1193142 RepID=A0ABP9L8M8_9RHOB|nr:hypothetical protein [Roseibacterium beibuensis]MCS6624334.1 hypothetical protein [Roseibacterium beibuensis]
MVDLTKTPAEVIPPTGTVKRSELITLLEEHGAGIDAARVAPVTVTSAGLTITAAHLGAHLVFGDVAAVALPEASSVGNGFRFVLEATAGSVTLTPFGSELINGAATVVVATSETAELVCTGSGWRAVIIRGLGTLGTAATKNAGTSAGDLVEVQSGGALPALDGRALTNIGGLPLIQRKTLATDTASLDFAVIPGTRFEDFELVLRYVKPTVDGTTLNLQVSTDSGATWEDGASDYQYFRRVWYNLGSTSEAGGTVAAVPIAVAVGGAAAEGGVCGAIRLFKPAGSQKTLIKFDLFLQDDSGDLRSYLGGAMHVPGGGVNAVRIVPVSGLLAAGSEAELRGLLKY